MSLSAKNRSALYRGLSDVVDEPEAIEEMLANFATRDDEEWASKEFIRAEMAAMRTEVHVEVQRIVMWSVGTNIALFGLLFALIRLTG
jgi:hypothetical protein